MNNLTNNCIYSENKNYKQFKTFCNVYKNKIEQEIKLAEKQFNYIVNNDYKAVVNLEESGGTFICLNRKNYTLMIQIEFDDVYDLYKLNEDKIDIFEAFHMLITHEYMHYLLQHLDPEFKKGLTKNSLGLDYNYINLVDGKFIKDFFLRNPLFVLADSDTKKFYTKYPVKLLEYNYDHKLANIAEDLYINELLNIPYPGLRPSQFNLPDNLECYEYYMILMYIKYTSSKFKNSETGKYFNNEFRFKIPWIIEYLENNLGVDINKILKLINSNEFNGEFIVVELNGEIKTSEDINDFREVYRDKKEQISNTIQRKLKEVQKETLPGRLSRMIEKMNCAKGGIWKDFKTCLNSIKKNEKEMRLSYMKYTDDWTKFNNRKDGSMIYPGRRQTSGGFITKMSYSSIIFVDISGSMEELMQPLYTFVYLALTDMDIKVVLYDTKIQKIYDGKNNLKEFCDTFGFAGGTDVHSAYLEYCKKFNKPHNVYVITDGFDNSLESIRNINGRIWVMDNNSLKEVK